MEKKKKPFRFYNRDGLRKPQSPTSRKTYRRILHKKEGSFLRRLKKVIQRPTEGKKNSQTPIFSKGKNKKKRNGTMLLGKDRDVFAFPSKTRHCIGKKKKRSLIGGHHLSSQKKKGGRRIAVCNSPEGRKKRHTFHPGKGEKKELQFSRKKKPARAQQKRNKSLRTCERKIPPPSGKKRHYISDRRPDSKIIAGKRKKEETRFPIGEMSSEFLKKKH